ncbi:hypothetical protein BJX66DRAFT_343929 [Aspergillus keveii]|uniref:Uncharacterized protein n=1 Tax=Aspergillus keveii TaxID=714993 RepID=A0ABR4FMS3_9EURO
MHLSAFLITALVASTNALQCLTPPPPSTLNLCQNWQVTWSHVLNDPAPPDVCIYLSNWGMYYPPHTILLRSCRRDDDACLISGQCYPQLANSGYRVRIASCSDPNTIYSECGQLTVNYPQSCCTRSRVMGRDTVIGGENLDITASEE